MMRPRRRSRRVKMPRRIAVIPIYNEGPTVLGVLTEVAHRVDRLIAVDDGSTDDTPVRLKRWAKGRKGVTIIRLPRTVGMAGAIKRGYLATEKQLKSGQISGNDIIINIDADGQHRPENIPNLVEYMVDGNWDVVLTRRDFSKYPVYKKVGNWGLSVIARLLSGFPYRDVESGFRLVRARTVPTIMDYFTGWRYSCAQEIALITAMKGFKVNNSYMVKISYYRPGTNIWDGPIVLWMSLLTFFRLKFGKKVR